MSNSVFLQIQMLMFIFWDFQTKRSTNKSISIDLYVCHPWTVKSVMVTVVNLTRNSQIEDHLKLRRKSQPIKFSDFLTKTSQNGIVFIIFKDILDFEYG